MTLAFPPALWGLGLLPVLVLLRVLARRPRVVVVPSLIPWRAAAAAAAPEGRRKLLLDWPLALQLAAVAAAVLGASGPRVAAPERAAPRVALVLDNSASMAARSGGASRLEDARARLRAELDRLGSGARGALAVTSPEPRLVTAADAPLGELLAALGVVEATDAPGDLLGALAAARAAAGGAAAVLAASDDVSALDNLPLDNAVVVRVGAPARNLGIVAAAVEDGRVFAAVRNASAGAEKARLALLAGGREVADSEAEVAAGARRAFTFALPPPGRGFLELRLPADDLAADNRAWLGAGPAFRWAALGRSAPSVERALAALGLDAPERPAAGAEIPAGVRLVLACGRWPGALPAGAFALVIDPPEGKLGGVEVSAGAAPAEARLAEGRAEFFPRAGEYSFRVPAAGALRAGAGAEVLLGGADRPLVVLAAGGSACALGFDPEATEWVKHPSFPVFFARLAERLPALSAMGRAFFRTGEALPAAVASGERLVAPSGRTVPAGAPLAEAGLYRAERAGAPPREFAANLLSERETACPLAGRGLRRVRAGGEAASPGRAALAPWLFALALTLLAGEWWLSARVRR